MTAEFRKVLMTYTEAKAFARTHGVRQREIPVEHAVSLLMPTMRFGMASYAYFASPATREPGRAMHQGAPDRWTVIDAHGGRVIVYALVEAFPFAAQTFAGATLPVPADDVARLRERLAALDLLMERAAARWFSGETLERARKDELIAALDAIIPAPLSDQYRALAPDFFAWLQS